MQNNLLLIVILLLIGIFVSNLLILFSLWKLKTNSTKVSGKFDERYLDLSLKFQFLLTTLLMVGALITILGWNVKSQITNDLRNEVMNDIKVEINSLTNKLSEAKETQKRQIELINNLDKKSKNIKKDFNLLNETVSAKLSNLKTLLNIYLVPDIPFDYDWGQIEDKPLRFYFNKLKPINAENLPKFKNVPIVNIQAQNMIFSVFKTTTEFVEVVPFGSLGKDTKITLWIVEK